MIYGYLRVSTDDQDVNSQKQGVDGFAKARGWDIEAYITDEGISGGKDPDKRNLGPLLSKLQKGDILICSEISRLGRDLYMVMDILHHCMKTGCVIYTVKDKFTLGDDIQSKVLAFAFGLSAEIERQMIRQRTEEGLRLRMKMGVLLGRPLGRENVNKTLDVKKEEVLTQYKWGVPVNRIAKNFCVDPSTVFRALERWGIRGDKNLDRIKKAEKAAKMNRYKEGEYKIVPLEREKTKELILANKTLPEMVEHYPEYTYEQLYDSILCDYEFNSLYRKHGMLRVVKKHY